MISGGAARSATWVQLGGALGRGTGVGGELVRVVPPASYPSPESERAVNGTYDRHWIKLRFSNAMIIQSGLVRRVVHGHGVAAQ